MARGRFFTAVIFFAMTSSVHMQFFDLFQALQPFVQSYPTYTEISTYDNRFTTKRPKTTGRHRPIEYDQNNKDKEISRRQPAIYTSPEGPLGDDARKRGKQTPAPIIDVSRLTSTTKPSRKTNKIDTSRRVVNSNTNDSYKPNSSRGTSRNISREIASSPKDVSRGTSQTSSSRVSYNEPIVASNSFSNDNNRNDKRKYNEENILTDYYTTRPNFYESTRPNNNYNSQTGNNNYNKGSKNNNYNVHTTQNPFYNRPGVRPASVDDRRPPITNRPPTRKPVYNSTPRSTEAGAIKFPSDTGISAELISGPDEDNMSDAEKRRYIEISERMCDKYKNLNTKQLQAIPLVPQPEPVKINVSSCVPSTIPLVVGGKVVSIREFPHMALIGWLKLHSSGYAWRCGGSLVSNQFVLTAAHCAYEERDNSIVMGTPKVVQLGSSYLDDPGALVVKVSAVYRHPKYKQPRSYYDLALLKLGNTISFSEVIKPACLGAPPRPNESFIATGWGRTEFGGDQSLELRSVSIPVWDMQECYSVLGKSRKLPNGPSSDSQLCAGERKGGKDTCQGDSGGPAQIQDGCVWRIVAVTSLGRSCGASNTPALYATVQRAFVSSVVFGGQIASTNNRGGNNEYQSNANNNYDRINNQRNNSNRYTTERTSFGTVNNNQNNRNPNQQNSNNYNTYNTQTQSNIRENRIHNTPRPDINEPNYNDYNYNPHRNNYNNYNNNNYNNNNYNNNNYEPNYNNQQSWWT